MHGWEPGEPREFLKKNTLSPGFNEQNDHNHSQIHNQSVLQFIENVSQH
jgi:hypothetical protein